MNDIPAPLNQQVTEEIATVAICARTRGAESEIVMAGIVNFRGLDAWKVVMDLVVSTYVLTGTLPASERYGLSAQMRRAAVSIPSNVAEGQANGAGRRNLQHVRIALGSLAELETQVEAARRLQLMPVDAFSGIDDQLKRTGQLLNGLRRSLWRQLLTKAVIGSAGLGSFVLWLV